MASYIILHVLVHSKEIWRGSQFTKTFKIQLLTAPPPSLLVQNTPTNNPFSNFSVHVFRFCDEQSCIVTFALADKRQQHQKFRLKGKNKIEFDNVVPKCFIFLKFTNTRDVLPIIM